MMINNILINSVNMFIFSSIYFVSISSQHYAAPKKEKAGLDDKKL